jgi:hypothetical protein
MHRNIKNISPISQTRVMFDNLKPGGQEYAVLMDLLSTSSWKGAGETKKRGITLKFKCGCTALYL